MAKFFYNNSYGALAFFEETKEILAEKGIDINVIRRKYEDAALVNAAR